jgi:hypothetical protein
MSRIKKEAATLQREAELANDTVAFNNGFQPL